MDARTGVIAVGVGLRAFLVAVVVTELVSSAVAFSASLGLVAGVAASGVAAAAAYLKLDRGAGSVAFLVAVAFAAFAYAVVALLLVRYAVSAVRPALSMPVVAGGVVAAAVAVLGTRRRSRAGVGDRRPGR